jgi:hypothetical protein
MYIALVRFKISDETLDNYRRENKLTNATLRRVATNLGVRAPYPYHDSLGTSRGW